MVVSRTHPSSQRPSMFHELPRQMRRLLLWQCRYMTFSCRNAGSNYSPSRASRADQRPLFRNAGYEII